MPVPEVDFCKACASSGFTYEHLVYPGGQTTKVIPEEKTWEECAELCHESSYCDVFSYNTVLKKCYLRKLDSFGKPIYKKDFVFSRPCGPKGSNNCPSVECETCSDFGYTTENEYYTGQILTREYSIELSDCAQQCDAALGCVGMTYDNQIKSCTLMSSKVGYPKRRSHYTYHQRHCS